MKNPIEFLTALLFGADRDEEHRRDLVRQFYATLRVTSFAAHSGQPADPAIEAKLKDLLAASPTWQGAYEIEQLLSQVMTPEQLDTELQRRIAEAKSLGLPHVDTVAPDPQAGDAKKRALFQRLLNDLQWFYTQRIQRRAAAKTLGLRVSAMFLSAFTFFFLVVSIQFFASPDTTVNNSINNKTDGKISIQDGTGNVSEQKLESNTVDKSLNERLVERGR